MKNWSFSPPSFLSKGQKSLALKSIRFSRNQRLERLLLLQMITGIRPFFRRLCLFKTSILLLEKLIRNWREAILSWVANWHSNRWSFKDFQWKWRKRKISVIACDFPMICLTLSCHCSFQKLKKLNLRNYLIYNNSPWMFFVRAHYAEFDKTMRHENSIGQDIHTKKNCATFSPPSLHCFSSTSKSY